jgi:uncharacterized protein YndB with AHSA1/START domain
MQKRFIARKSITIHVSPKRVWKALVEPDQVKEYFFGTQVISDWKVGGPIRWMGTWQGKTYEDKGTILQIFPEKLLQYTYWSSMGGFEDRPENYVTVTFELNKAQQETGSDEGTVVTVSQDNNDTESERDHSEKNWEMVLGALKKFIEK